MAELLPVGDPSGSSPVGEQTEKEALHGMGEGPSLFGGLESQEEDQEEDSEQEKKIDCLFHENLRQKFKV